MDELRKILLGIFALVLVLFLTSRIKNCSGSSGHIQEPTNEEEQIILHGEDSEKDITIISTLEDQVIAEVNKCRKNPSQYAEDVLVPYLNSITKGNYIFHGKLCSMKEGKEVVSEAIYVLKNQKPLCQLEYSQPLYFLAKEHCDTQGPSGEWGHDRANGVSFQQRASDLGLEGCGENISYGFNDARMIVIQLLVDDGVPSRGHRENILRSEYRKIGVAMGSHKKYDYMCVLDFQL